MKTKIDITTYPDNYLTHHVFSTLTKSTIHNAKALWSHIQKRFTLNYKQMVHLDKALDLDFQFMIRKEIKHIIKGLN